MEENKLFQVRVKGFPSNSNEDEYSTLFGQKGKFKIIDKQYENSSDSNKNSNTIQLILQYDSEIIAKEAKSLIQGKKILNSELAAEIVSIQQNMQPFSTQSQQQNYVTYNGNTQQQSHIASNQEKSSSQSHQMFSNQDQNLSQISGDSQSNYRENYENTEENYSDQKTKLSSNNNNENQQSQGVQMKNSPYQKKIKINKSSISPATFNENPSEHKEGACVISNDNYSDSNITYNQNDSNNDHNALNQEQAEKQQNYGEEKINQSAGNNYISSISQNTKQISLTIVKQDKNINTGSATNSNGQIKQISISSQNNATSTTPTAVANAGGVRVINLKKKESGLKLIDKLIIKQKPQGNQNEFEGRQNLQPSSSENLNLPLMDQQIQGGYNYKNQNTQGINGSNTVGKKILKIHQRNNEAFFKQNEEKDLYSNIVLQGQSQNFHKKMQDNRYGKIEQQYKRQPQFVGQMNDMNNNNNNSDQINNYGLHKMSSNNNSQTNISYQPSQNQLKEQKGYNSSLNQSVQISNQQQKTFPQNQNQQIQINKQQMPYQQQQNQYSQQYPQQNHLSHYNYNDKKGHMIMNKQGQNNQPNYYEGKSLNQSSSIHQIQSDIQDIQAQKKRLHKLIHERVKLIHRRHQRENKKKYHCLHVFHRLNSHCLNGQYSSSHEIKNTPEYLRKMDYLEFTKYLRYKLERASSPSIEREFFLNDNTSSQLTTEPNHLLQNSQQSQICLSSNQISSNSQINQSNNQIKQSQQNQNTSNFEQKQILTNYSQNHIQNTSHIQHSDNQQNYQNGRSELKDENTLQYKKQQLERENSSLSSGRNNHKDFYGNNQQQNKKNQKRDYSQSRKGRNSRSRSQKSKSRSNSKLRQNNQYKNKKFYNGNQYKYNDQRNNRFSPSRKQNRKYKNKSSSPSQEQNKQQFNNYNRNNQQQDGYYKKSQQEKQNGDKKKDFQRYKNGRNNNSYNQNKKYKRGIDNYNQSSYNNLENQDYEFQNQNNDKSQINKSNENKSRSPCDKNKLTKGEKEDPDKMIEFKYVEKFSEKENFKQTLSDVDSHKSPSESKENLNVVKPHSHVINSSQKFKNDYDDMIDYGSDNDI